MSGPTNPRFEPDVVVKFLDTMYPGDPRQIIVIHEKHGIRAQSFSATDASSLVAWVGDHVQAGWNVYFAVNPLKGQLAKKATKVDVARSDFMFVDIDPRAGEDVSTERSRILSVIRQYRLPPTCIIDSGGGYQAIWRLSDGLPVDGDGPLTAAVEASGLALELELGGDSCRNIERVLRLPGTVNFPNAQKRKKGRLEAQTSIVEMNSLLTYGIQDFPANRAESVPTNRNWAPTSVNSLDELAPFNVPAWLYANIEHGADVARVNFLHKQNSWPRANNPYPSRSEIVFSVTCELVRAAVPDSIIAGIITNPHFGISASVIEQKNAAKYAQKQLRDAHEVAFSGPAQQILWPDLTVKGTIKPTYRNAVEAIKALGITAEHDVFKRRLVMGGQLLDGWAGEVTDHTVMLLRDLLISEFRVDFDKKNVNDAAVALCVANPVNPVAAYLDKLTWDGEPRLDTWLSRYLGVPDTPLSRVIGRKVLLAAVLEGKQGAGKSLALEILASEQYFSDATIFGQQGREQQEAVAGIWIYEIGELAGLRKAAREVTKAFLSRTRDRARPAYGKYLVDSPRTCIFIGTTNDQEYLQDPTGNRRFWPVRVGKIDLDGLRKDRDQIWAEAAAPENAHEPLTLPEEYYHSAGEEQAARVVADPWIDKLTAVEGHLMPNGTYRIWSSELYIENVLGIATRDRTPAISARVIGIMRSLGWEGPTNIRIKKGEKPQSGFVRQVSHKDDPEPDGLLTQDEFPF
jgi:hypothetical protein